MLAFAAQLAERGVASLGLPLGGVHIYPVGKMNSPGIAAWAQMEPGMEREGITEPVARRWISGSSNTRSSSLAICPDADFLLMAALVVTVHRPGEA